MTQDSFELECDRLSNAVDSVQYERLRWSKNEGPMLARLVELAHGALESRSEFELVEEGATSDIKRFVLKVHGNRVAAIVIWLEGSRPHIKIEEIQRGKYVIADASPLSAEFAEVDEAWMARSLQALFGRIQAQA